MSPDNPAAPSSGPAAPPELLGHAFRQLPEALVMTDAQLDAPGPVIVAVNPAFCRLTGYDASELLGRTPRILQGPLTDRTTLDRLRRCASNGQRFEGEAINYRKDGTTYLVEWSMDAVRDSEGRITHYVAVQRDLTGKRRAPATVVSPEAPPLELLSEQGALLAEAVMILEKTKRSFRSTDLGRLRQRFEAALQSWSTLARRGDPPAPKE